MKKLKKWKVFWLLAAVSLATYAAIPQKFRSSLFVFGNNSSSVSTTYNVSGTDGIMLYGVTGFDFDQNVGVTGNVAATGNVSGVLGSFLGTPLTFGNGAASDQDFIVDIGAGGSNPFIRWDNATTSLVFSNDGSTTKKFGDTTGADVATTISNFGLDDSVGASALTIGLVLKDGFTIPSGASSVEISFRNATLTNGGYIIRSATSALSIVVTSDATLGTVDAVENDIYVYAIDNAGTVELAVSLTPFLDETILYSTTLMDATSDSPLVLYSTTARTGVPLRFLGTITNSQTSAGTWAAVATSIQVGFKITPPTCHVRHTETSGTQSGTFTASGSFEVRPITDKLGGKDCQWVVIDTAADDFDLPIGGYEIDGYASTLKVGNNKAKLRNTSDSTDDILGSSERNGVADDMNSPSIIKGSILLTAEKAFQIQHRALTTRANNGFGFESTFGVIEVYMDISIRKIK